MNVSNRSCWRREHEVPSGHVRLGRNLQRIRNAGHDVVWAEETINRVVKSRKAALDMYPF